MTRAKDISKIVTDADLSGTLDVTGTVTTGGLNSSVSRTSGANATAITLSDNVTGAQTSGFGTRIVGASNNNGAVSAIGFEADGGTNNDTAISLYTQPQAGLLRQRFKVSRDGDISFYEDTGSSPKFFWDSSAESLGIQTSSPSAPLHINGTSSLSTEFKVGNSTWNSSTGSGMLHQYRGSDGYSELQLNSTSTSGSNVLTIRDGSGVNSSLYNDGSAYFGGNVGIGETVPLGILHIKEGDSGVTSVSTDADQLVIENNAESGISILAPTNSASRIAFGDSDNNKIGQIYYNHTSNFMKFDVNNAERMRIDSSGRVLVAVTSAIASSGAKIHVNAGSSGSLISETSLTTQVFHVHFRNGNGGVGGIETSGTSTAYATSSDHRLKENVTADWDATTRLKQLNPVRFNFIADADTTVDGFLAHEVQSVVPEAITGTHNEVDDDGNPVYQGIDQSKLVPLLVKTIQELEARITALENGE